LKQSALLGDPIPGEHAVDDTALAAEQPTVSKSMSSPLVRDNMIPVLAARLAAMEPIEKVFIVMAVIGLVGLVSTVVYLVAR
jgi:hypothetical protein